MSRPTIGNGKASTDGDLSLRGTPVVASESAAKQSGSEGLLPEGLLRFDLVRHRGNDKSSSVECRLHQTIFLEGPNCRAGSPFQARRASRAWLSWALVLVCLWATLASAQLPPPPPLPPDPFGLIGNGSGAGTASGSQQIINKLVTSGMGHSTTGQPPFGSDATGNPIWPLGNPYTPTTSAPGTSTPGVQPPGPASILADPGAGTEGQAYAHLEKINELPARKKAETVVIRPLINAYFPLGQASRRGTGRTPLTAQDILQLKYTFLMDLQQHARYVYEGKNALALALAFKWRVLDRLYPDRIEEVTLGIALQKGWPSFEKFIAWAIQEDLKYVSNP